VKKNPLEVILRGKKAPQKKGRGNAGIGEGFWEEKAGQ